MHKRYLAPDKPHLRQYIVLALCFCAFYFSGSPSLAGFGFKKDAPATPPPADEAPDPNDPLVQAQSLLSDKKYQDALDAYKLLYQSKPRDPNVLLGLAAASERTGDLNSAIKYATAATVVAPDSPQSHIALAVYLDQNRESEHAYLQYLRAADLNPPEATMEKIFSPTLRLMMAAGNKVEALKQAKKWANDFPKRADCQYNYACLLTQCDDKKVVEAIETYQKALKLDPKLADTHYNLALLFLKLNQPDDVIKELKRFIEDAPDDSDIPQAKKLLDKEQALVAAMPAAPEKGAKHKKPPKESKEAKEEKEEKAASDTKAPDDEKAEATDAKAGAGANAVDKAVTDAESKPSNDAKVPADATKAAAADTKPADDAKAATTDATADHAKVAPTDPKAADEDKARADAKSAADTGAVP